MILVGCCCSVESGCNSLNCICSCGMRAPFSYTSDGRLKEQYLLEELLSPIIQCGPLCSCDSNCSNRLLSLPSHFSQERFEASDGIDAHRATTAISSSYSEMWSTGSSNSDLRTKLKQFRNTENAVQSVAAEVVDYGEKGCGLRTRGEIRKGEQLFSVRELIEPCF